MVELEYQNKAVQERGEGSWKKGAPPIEDKTASDNGENIHDREIAFFSSREIDEACDEKVIDYNLNKGKSLEVFNLFEMKGI